MKCRNCGYEIPQGMLYCKRCGEELRIVPDYNPLDDMLTSQIRVSINNDNDNEQYRAAGNKRNIDDREVQRRKAEKRRAMKKRKRRRLIIIMSVFLALIIGILLLLYFTSYGAVVKRGDKALQSMEYAQAQEYYEKAIMKKPEQPDAYSGLSKLYIAKNDLTNAEKVYLDAIAEYPENASLYEEAFLFYLDTNQALKIPEVLSKASDKVKKALDEYKISKPKFSLDENKLYDDVQQLSLTSEEEIIYYSVDGSEPTFSSMKYTEPIHLEEGETVVKAFAVNDKGVPSLTVSKKYLVELPIEDAPAVSPSTGQYEENIKIEIKVPDGYTAYYTMDGSTPTTASTKYTGPINMPENDTLFKAILVNAGGRCSGVTTRNYILEIPEETE